MTEGLIREILGGYDEEISKLRAERDEARKYAVRVRFIYDGILDHCCDEFPGLYDYLLDLPGYYKIDSPPWERTEK